MVAEARARLSLDGKPFTDTLRGVADEAEGKFTKSMQNVGRGIAAAFTVNKMVSFAQEIMSTADQVDNLSDRLGFSAETVQSLGVVAKDSGLGFEKFEAAILKVNKSIVQASSGNAELTKHFESLGLSVDDLQSLNPEQVFERIAIAMSQNKGDADTLNAAFKILGDEAGPKLMTAMEQLGDVGFANLNKDMLETGRIMSGELVTSLDRAEQKIAIVTDAVKNRFAEFAGFLIEKLEAVAMETTVENLREMERESKNLADLLKRRQDEHIDRQNEINRLAAEQLDIEAQLALADEKLAALSVEKVDAATELATLKARESELEDEIGSVITETSAAYEQRVKDTNDLVKVKGDIAKLETTMAAEEKKNNAERQRVAASLESAKARYNKLVFDGLTNEQKSKQLESERLALLRVIAENEINGLDNTEDQFNARAKVLEIDKQIAALTEKNVIENEKLKEINTEQLEKMIELRDVFKGMTENEIAKFVEGLTELAKKINEVPKVQSLQWMKDLSDFRLPKQFTSSQGAALGRAIKAFFEALDLNAGGAPNLAFLEDLKKVGELELPKQFTSNQARDIAAAIKELLKGFDGINAVDVGKLQTALELVKALMAAGPGGKWEVDIKLPEGFENGIPLIMPEGLAGTFVDLAASAKTLASMKGVIFA